MADKLDALNQKLNVINTQLKNATEATPQTRLQVAPTSHLPGASLPYEAHDEEDSFNLDPDYIEQLKRETLAGRGLEPESFGYSPDSQDQKKRGNNGKGGKKLSSPRKTLRRRRSRRKTFRRKKNKARVHVRS